MFALMLSGFVSGASAQSNKVVELYKSPYCGCCGAWGDHMKAAGFEIKEHNIEDLNPIKAKYGVTDDLQSCHTAIIDGHVIEGHVPAQDIEKLLAEGGEKAGLAAPGMPVGSPGMEQGDMSEPYQVIRFSKTERSVFAQH
ncbi:DUF411 domain-containing protein [Ochrobactrum sp. SFR4]|nr:DUF411 domain-containing protein [Ochrobactrum sp. SFR4]